MSSSVLYCCNFHTWRRIFYLLFLKLQGTSTSTGYAEPPRGKKPIVPGKAPTGKNRRRVVTPEEINSLFLKNSRVERSAAVAKQDNNASPATVASNNNSGDSSENFAVYWQKKISSALSFGSSDDFDDEDGNKSDIGEDTTQPTENVGDKNKAVQVTGTISGTATSELYANIQSNDEIPKWLQEADKRAEAARKGIRKRKKKLTDDWRFWIGVIATVGFATAFFQVYQQTGGFSPDIYSFGTSLGGAAGVEADELII